MKRVLILLTAVLILAAPFQAKAALQCVTYARQVSGLNLKGDAWQWWSAANGVYERGRAPREGGVLVFARQGSMRHGHVSVVTRIVNNRVVLVDHANWAPSRSAGRGKVTHAVPVIDVSPRNDWSEVRVWHEPASDYGTRVYRTEGFVFRPGPPVQRASLTASAPAKEEHHAKAEPVVAHPAPKAEAHKAEPAKVEAATKAEPVPASAPVATPASAPARAFNPADWAEQS
ncbi:MAG: CHAP domain-containing protein [Actinomycetota bacterium]